MKKLLSYIFTVPACTLFLIAEKIRGEKLSWRWEEAIKEMKVTCSKCKHRGYLREKEGVSFEFTE